MRIWRAALVFGLAGVASAGIVQLWYGFNEPKYMRWFLPAAFLSAAATGGAAWWIASRRRAEAGLWRAGMFGMAAALAAHPLFWWLVFTGAYLSEVKGSLGQRTVSPISPQGVWGALLYGLFSVRVAGLVTLPMGVVAGFTLALIERSRARS